VRRRWFMLKARIWMWIGVRAARKGGNVTRNAMLEQLNYAIEHAEGADHRAFLVEYREKLQKITYA
jgi:hypothetical protein